MRRNYWIVIAELAASAALLASCTDERSATALPLAPTEAATAHRGPPPGPPPGSVTPRMVRELAAAHGIGPLPRTPHVRPQLVRLGRALAFDPILSGNRNISCTTCHLPAFAMGDERSLSIGAGGTGLGPQRSHPDGVNIPRNAPAAFNLGSMRHLFWDGRVELDGHGHVHTPAGTQVTPKMQKVFEFGAVSALGMFPVTSRTEMRGMSGNELAAIPDDDLPAIWQGIMRRLGNIREYRELFEAAYPRTRFKDMTFAHASNAIGGFLVSDLTFRNSPWDRFLAGNNDALNRRQLEGAQTFLTLKCSACHMGATFSDEQFHDVAVAQIGPGEGNGVGGRDDFGRMNVTGDPADRYRFRTTPLRNVDITGPYGHDGSIKSLRTFVEHYSESDVKLLEFDPMTLDPSLRGTLLANATDILAQRDTLLAGVVLTPDLVDKLMDYMGALTDPDARHLSRMVPRRVPSGLPVDHPR
jgi:cytochrome c peroxidase